MISFSFSNWDLQLVEAEAQQLDNNTIEVVVNGTFPAIYETWDLLIKYKDNIDVVTLEQESTTKYKCLLSAAELAFTGFYTFQVQGTYSNADIDEEDYLRHSSTIDVSIPESIDADANWPEIPTAFTQAVQQAEAASTSAASSATAAAASAEEIEDMTVTSQTSGTTGTPSVAIEKTTVSGHYNLGFTFTNIKGETGEKGDTGDPRTWDTLEGKPSTFTPSAHTHNSTDIYRNGVGLNELLDAKYEKPSTGIPKSDMEYSVRASLNKADTAIQSHQSLAGYYTKTEADAKFISKIKTINNQSLIGEGNIDIQGGGASSWTSLIGKPFENVDTNTLKVDNSTLKVNTTDDAEEDNTKPITSSGVYTLVGNINTLLSII